MISDPAPRDHAVPGRIVVNAVGDHAHGQLSESRFIERAFLTGGEHELYEFAFAAVVLGHDVELRGWLHRPAFERLAEGTGVAPRVNLPARRPERDDLVVVPEGWQEPLDYARLVLSPAQLSMFILAAPGLFGWPFVAESWVPPDPLTVPLDEVARPEHFRGMAAIGFRLMTNSPGIAAAAHAAGVDCAFIGTGCPGWLAPEPIEKTTDVAAVLDNRWAPLAENVLEQLEGFTVDRIESVSNAEMLERLARARVLVWPSRIEGHARIQWEARSVGCVPVALDSNRFALGLDDAHGAVVVATVPELAEATRRLLHEPSRMEVMARRARETAPAEVEWGSYLGRVREFLENPPSGEPAQAPRAGIGAALEALLEARAASEHAKALELQAAARDLEAATANQERMLAEIDHWRTLFKRLEAERKDLLAERDRLFLENHELRAEIEALRADRDRIASQLQATLDRRSVRAALKAADLVKPWRR